MIKANSVASVNNTRYIRSFFESLRVFIGKICGATDKLFEDLAAAVIQVVPIMVNLQRIGLKFCNYPTFISRQECIMSTQLQQNIKRLFFIALIYAPLAILLHQCSSITNALFPASQDVGLGSQLDREIRANPKEYPILNDAISKQYVQNIVNQIIQAKDIQYRGVFTYRTEIIRDDKTINAFCTPGGYIYVYTGLIKMLDNEASLAGVLGHEIAHAERRHSANRMLKAYGAQMLMSMVLGDNPGKTEQVAANLFTGLALLKNSRDDESEADDYSFRYLRSTKWYPGAISYFFEKVKRQSSGGAAERLLSTHPMPQDRLEAVKKHVQEAKLAQPTEANLFSEPYTSFKKRLP